MRGMGGRREAPWLFGRITFARLPVLVRGILLALLD